MLIYLNVRRGFTAWPLIVVPKKLKGTVRGRACYVHEQVHYKKQKWITPFWVIWYFVSKSFRWQKEKTAYTAEIRYLQAAGAYVDRDKYVKMLAEQYWNMCTKKQAEDFMDNLLRGNRHGV